VALVLGCVFFAILAQGVAVVVGDGHLSTLGTQVGLAAVLLYIAWAVCTGRK
jgi:hypothetical protein